MNLNVQRCKTPTQIRKAVDFFIENVSEKYISHGEVLCGRATVNFKWSKKLRTLLRNEFKENTFLFFLENHIVGLIVLRCVQDIAHLEDLVIDRKIRKKGLGGLILEGIHDSVKKQGCKILFLDRGSE